MQLLLSLDPRHPESHHAAIVSTDPTATDPHRTIAYVAGRTFHWNTPLSRTILRFRSWQVHGERLLQGTCWILIVLGCLASLHFIFFQTSTRISSTRIAIATQDGRLLLSWIGLLSALCLSYLRQGGGKRVRPLPVRPLEEELYPMGDDGFLPSTGPTIPLEHSLSEEATLLLGRALDLARTAGHATVLPLHLFAAARETRALRLLCQRLAISQEVLLVKLQNLLALQPVHAETQEPRCTQHLYAALLAAGLECFRERRSSITVTELLIGCTDVDPDLQELFLSLDIQLEVLRHVGRWMHFSECYRRQWKEIRTLASQKPRSHMNRALTARPTPLLDVLGTDYTQIARRGGFPHLVARERELREVLRTLQSHLGNILLVGEPGTGKSEILKGIANLMAAEDVPPHLVDQRLVVLDPGALIGGSEGVGGVEGLSRRVLEEITKAGNILLGIEDIHHLLGAGSMRSSEDAGHMLMNALSEKKIRVIATTTTQEYARYLQPVETFLRRFQVIRIEEMDFLDTLTVLEARASGIEAKYEVQLSFPCLQACYELSLRLLSERYFPDKAIQILEESAALAREKRSKHTTVTKEDVAGVISRKTNVAVTSITEPEAARLLKLEEAMHERIIGQEEAVRAIASALRRARTGLRSPHRPIACLLFLGPTGVGKTATAKTIAKVYFGSENTMTRLDMSEYQTVESAERLLGHTGQTSPFLNTIRRNPHRLLLLDEFEKAHPDIMNLFLQLFDDGRLTDGSGHTVDFTHTLVIASSNAGSSRIEAALRRGETHEQVQRTLLQEELPKIFSPELLNRFDHTIIFEPLSHEHILKIAEQMVQTLSETLAEKGIQLIITPPALRELVRRGHDRRYGARPLRRTIQDTLEDPISQVILRGEVTRRDTIIVEEGGKIEVRKARVL